MCLLQYPADKSWFLCGVDFITPSTVFRFESIELEIIETILRLYYLIAIIDHTLRKKNPKQRKFRMFSLIFQILNKTFFASK